MLPHQRNKIDISSLSEEEQKVFRLYGKLPDRRDLLENKLKERKYFDSGDYALSKAGRAPQQSVGTAIPNPENVPHASATSPTHSPSMHGSGLSLPGSHGAMDVPGARSGAGAGHQRNPSATTASPSSFPTATGFSGNSPGRDGTSSLSREQLGNPEMKGV